MFFLCVFHLQFFLLAHSTSRPHRRIEVDYEEVLKDKENLRPVYKFLGLEPPPAGADKTVKMHPTDIPW